MGETLTIRWVMQEGNPDATDFIGLYPVGFSDRDYITYQYVDAAKVCAFV